jgi:hypothetical protein
MFIKTICSILTVLIINAMLVVGCDESPSNPNENLLPVSFSQDILQIFQQHGCTSCHGGEAGLFVTTVGGLLQGGDHGPAIIRNDAENSNLVRKLSSNPPFGERMPLGASPVPENQQNTIKQWINEGAEDN